MVPKYPYIRIWGRRLGSFASYIGDQVAHAIRVNAPDTAVYFNTETQSWVLLEDLRPELQEELKELIRVYYT